METLKLRTRLLWQLVAMPALVFAIFCVLWAVTSIVVALLVAVVPQSRWPARARWARYQRILNWPGRVWDQDPVPWWAALSDSELRYCQAEGIDPVTFAARTR